VLAGTFHEKENVDRKENMEAVRDPANRTGRKKQIRKREERGRKKTHSRNFTPLLVGIDMPLPSPLEGGSWLLFFNSFVYSLFIEKEVQTPTSGFI